MLVLEAVLMSAAGALLGFGFLYAGLIIAQPIVDAAFGLFLPITAPALREMLVVIGVIGAGAIVSMVPAVRAYRMSLADGMMVKS